MAHVPDTPARCPVVPSAAFFARPGHAPLVIAHRGGSLEAPENTLEALRHGVEAGADWQEVDVALTQDEEPVILHDDTLDRTTDGLGEVADKTLAELVQLKVGTPRWDAQVRERLKLLGLATLPTFANLYPEARLPHLKAALAVPKVRLMLELKTTRRPETMARRVLEEVARANATGRVAIASFDHAVLDAVQARAPWMPLVGLAETLPEARAMLQRRLTVLGVHTDCVAAAWAMTPPHVALWTWTVYTQSMADRAVAQGADGLITDVPTQLMGALRGFAPLAAPVSRG